MSIQVNGNAGAVNWDALLSKLGEVTKTEGADGVAGTTNVTITTNVDGVETPVTIRIPDDLDIPAAVDQAAIDSLCEKLAANSGLNLTEEQIKQFHDALSAVLTETLDAMPKGDAQGAAKRAMFDLYKMMALLVEVAQKQRDATREMRLAENLAIQKSILNQADAQRQAAVTGMIAGAICCALQIGATGFALYKQSKAFNAQLGTEKTAGLDVARQNLDMTKAANSHNNAEAQLSKVKADVGNKMSLDGVNRIGTKVEQSFDNPQFTEAEARYQAAKSNFQTKTELSQTMKALGSDAYIDEVTGNELAGFDQPEVAGVKAAVAKLDAFKADADAKLAGIRNLSPADKQFFIEKSTQPFESLSMADRSRLIDIQMRHQGLAQVHLDGNYAQLKADVKAAFNELNANLDAQLAPNGQLRAELDLAKTNYRSQVELEVQKFEDAYDAELKNYNEVRTSGTKAEIAEAETRLQTANDQLKYARAYGHSKLMASPDITDSKTHLKDVESARANYLAAQQSRANSVDYIKASNAITEAQATNNLIAAIGGFAQSFVQSWSQLINAEATKMGAEQKKSEEELDQTKDLFNQAEELVNNVVQLMNAVRQAEMQSMRDAIQA